MEFIQILSDRKHKGKIHLQMCIKQLVSFSLNHSNVSFCFFFSILKCTRLNYIYPLSITEMYSRLAVWTTSTAKRESGGKLKQKNMWVGFWMCSYSIFFSFFFCWISYLGVKRESGGEEERRQLEWGDSLRRGVHADETYLGRPCVHGAPKLPVLKHWLAVSSVSFPWIRKGCCAFHLI